MSETDNRLRWRPGTRGVYEVYYLKVNDPVTGHAWWLRYTLTAPPEGHGPAVAEVWGVFFDGADPQGSRALKETHPLSGATWSDHPFSFSPTPAATLRHDGATGRLEGPEGYMRWELRWTPSPETFRLMPYRWMERGPFPKTKVVSPNMDLRATGWIEVGERRFELESAPGQQTHIWGSKHAEQWVWAHCNAFRESDAVFEALSAVIAPGRRPLPPLTAVALRVAGRWFVFNGPRQLLWRNRTLWGLPRWEFEARSSDHVLRGELTCPIDRFVGVGYRDPDGDRLVCYNTKIAAGRLRLYRAPRPGRAELLHELVSEGTMALEFVQRYLDPRIEQRI